MTNYRIMLAARLLTSLSAVLLLILPIVILYSLDSMTARLQAITFCASVFAVSVSLISQARVIEIFSATAA